jgi:hypothetical protein
VLASHKPPGASGEIVQVWAYTEHVETSGIDANGDAMAKESFDQVLLFAHVKLHNQSKVPLTLQDVLANVSWRTVFLSRSPREAWRNSRRDFSLFPSWTHRTASRLRTIRCSIRGRAWTGPLSGSSG